MDSPPTNIPLSLDVSCSSIEWLHDRSTVHVPIGRSAFKLARESAGTSVAEMTAMMFYQHGVQPVVLTIPPLMKLLVVGCGCKKCEACATSDDQFEKGWITAHQLLCFYAAVLQTNAVSTVKKAKKNAPQTKPIDKFLGEVHRWMRETLKTQHDQGDDSDIGRIWAQMWAVLGDSTSSDQERVAVLRPLADEFACQPGYTLAIIHKMEQFVWASIMRRSPLYAGKDQAAAAQALMQVHPALVECPPANIEPVSQWCHDSDICDEVSAWTQTQDRAVRRLMCGTETGTQLTQWPSIRLPSTESVAAAVDCKYEDVYVSARSSIYTVISLVYGQLFASRKPEVAAPDVTPAKKALPAIEEASAAGQH